ncbi:MAG: polysaccharide pyruvyl transferase family protein [Nanoarchaeota archaeon]|nr:polysaccharide pyruvyl transferase family protein [Nanoarchaeota archaeon]
MKNKIEILTWYWIPDLENKTQLNFGEHITPILLEKFGYMPIAYQDAESKGNLKKYKECIFVIGSEFHKAKIDQIEIDRILIWGQGKGRVGDKFELRLNDTPYSERIKVFAVRGPHTIRQLFLKKSTPTGDPGFLMPIFFQLTRIPSKDVLYAPNHSNRIDIDRKVKEIGANCFFDVIIHKKFYWTELKKLVNAKFVLTNSMHVAIIRHAYRAPWALCLPKGDILDMPDKWKDVMEFLGIEHQFKVVKNMQEGLSWWNEVKSQPIPSMLPMLNAFPYKIINKEALEIIEKYKKTFE